MKYKTFFLLLFHTLFLVSQEAEHYSILANQIIPVKTDSIIDYYKNGNIKRTYSMTTYNIIDEEYSCYSGLYIEFEKNEDKSFERLNDMFGVPLSSKIYFNGMIIVSTKTIEFDTSAKTVEEFLYGRRNLAIIIEYEEYKTDSNNSPKLFKKGIKVNDKKSGLWTTYRNGEIKKTKTYREIDKFEKLTKTIYKK